jgi:hypothetical protein
MVTISHDACHIPNERLPNSEVKLGLTKRNDLSRRSSLTEGTVAMNNLSALRHLPVLRMPRMVRDFLTGLVIFAAILGVVTFSPLSNDPNPTFSGAALAGQFTMPSQAQGLIAADFKPNFTPSTRIVRTTEQTQGLLILGLAFSAMVAFNLAFLRHLRRVYASPRQGAWRRGE